MIKMKVGDLVLVPHGSNHTISCAPGIRCVPAAQYLKARASGKPMFQGMDDETLMIGGHFEFPNSTMHPFVKSLPRVIWMDNTNIEVSLWLQQVAGFMNEEVFTGKPGSQVLLGRLAEVLFILIIRSYLQRTNIKSGFLLALKDERISSSLKLMHEAPAKDWTLNQLAKAVGMSRSLYSKDFKKLVGETPLSYLTNWRILRSKELLSGNKTNIIEVASNVGYQSEAAFNRIFKSKVGETPASYRRRVMALQNNPLLSVKSLDPMDEVRKTYQRQNDERAIEVLKKLNLSKDPREEESQVQKKKQDRRPRL